MIDKAILELMTHDFVPTEPSTTILCSVPDTPRFPGDGVGHSLRMLAATHVCRKCGLAARTDFPPSGGWGDCNLAVVRSVLQE